MNTKILVAVGATVLLTSIGMNAYLFKEVRGLKIDSESHDRLNLHQIDINDFLVRDVIVMKMMLGISRPEEGWWKFHTILTHLFHCKLTRVFHLNVTHLFQLILTQVFHFKLTHP